MKEQIEKSEHLLESEWHKTRLLNFFELSAIESELLRDRIEKNNGLIRLFVHSYFELSNTHPEKNKKIQTIHKAIEQILALWPEKTPPIFFMEEENKIKVLVDRLMLIIQNKAYIIPTYPGTATPKSADSPPAITDWQQETKNNWSKLINTLKEYGVKKIIVGGMNLSIEVIVTKETARVDLWQCVGRAVNSLSKDFEVEISNLTFPQNRKDFEEAKAQIKTYNPNI